MVMVGVGGYAGSGVGGVLGAGGICMIVGGGDEGGSDGIVM